MYFYTDKEPNKGIMKKQYAIIVGGGSGVRMGAELPKQFLEICGKPIILHTIEKFLQYNKEIHLKIVIPKDYFELLSQSLKRHKINCAMEIVEGGNTRFDSVKNGLKAINEDCLVAIHDAVRPLVSTETIRKCFENAEIKGSSVPVYPINESIRLKTQDGTKSVDRSQYLSVQTPQVFDYRKISKAYEQEYDETLTDDASVYEKAGQNIFTTEGNTENIKITRKIDLIIAESILTKG